MSSRDLILGRIRASIGRSGAADAKVVSAHLAAAPRGPAAMGSWRDSREGILQRFTERATALSSTVERVATWAEVPAAAAAYLIARELPTQAVCWADLTQQPWAGAGLTVEARPARGDDLVGITGTFCAVADTGTLMLLSGPQTPAAASLLPETHIAVVPVERVVALMEDGFALLRAEKGEAPRAVNFVSGPSRTADIEQTVSLGAHGPYRVHLILVG
ncbi:MAG TPA: lactate utilization protein C [Azospira sp.]|nr:lactate utilization protein C [Azospira sp.]